MLRRLRLPQVMLLIDTSSVYGRELIEGIGRYAAEHGPWSIYHEDRGLLDPLPPSLKGWRGDGIIARSVRKADQKRLLATGLPVVELFADFALEPAGRCIPTRNRSASWPPIISSIVACGTWPILPTSGLGGSNARRDAISACLGAVRLALQLLGTAAPAEEQESHR